jgi:hypothetical protein
MSATESPFPDSATTTVSCFTTTVATVFMADAGSVIYSRNPAALASALEKISKYSDFNGSYLPKSVQALLTVAPKDEKTHPPLDKRIEILKCLDSGIGLNAQNYAEAYESVLGTKISFNDQPAT